MQQEKKFRQIDGCVEQGAIDAVLTDHKNSLIERPDWNGNKATKIYDIPDAIH